MRNKIIKMAGGFLSFFSIILGLGCSIFLNRTPAIFLSFFEKNSFAMVNSVKSSRSGEASDDFANLRKSVRDTNDYYGLLGEIEDARNKGDRERLQDLLAQEKRYNEYVGRPSESASTLNSTDAASHSEVSKEVAEVAHQTDAASADFAKSQKILRDATRYYDLLVEIEDANKKGDHTKLQDLLAQENQFDEYVGRPILNSIDAASHSGVSKEVAEVAHQKGTLDRLVDRFRGSKAQNEAEGPMIAMKKAVEDAKQAEQDRLAMLESNSVLKKQMALGEQRANDDTMEAEKSVQVALAELRELQNSADPYDAEMQSKISNVQKKVHQARAEFSDKSHALQDLKNQIDMENQKNAAQLVMKEKDVSLKVQLVTEMEQKVRLAIRARYAKNIAKQAERVPRRRALSSGSVAIKKEWTSDEKRMAQAEVQKTDMLQKELVRGPKEGRERVGSADEIRDEKNEELAAMRTDLQKAEEEAISREVRSPVHDRLGHVANSGIAGAKTAGDFLSRSEAGSGRSHEDGRESSLEDAKKTQFAVEQQSSETRVGSRHPERETVHRRLSSVNPAVEEVDSDQDDDEDLD